MSPKRPLVLIIQPYVPTYRASFFSALVVQAYDAGVDVVVAAGKPTGNQASRNDMALLASVLPLRQREFTVFGRRLTIRAWPRVARDADLIILEQARRNIDAYRLLLPKFIRTRSIALWGHGDDYAGSLGPLDAWLRRMLTRRADWFFAYTSAGVVSVHRQGLPQGRSTEVRNSTDTAALKSHLAVAEVDKARHSTRTGRGGCCTAAYIGALDKSKRIEMLLAAGALVHKELPAFKLIVAGDGPERELVELAARSLPWLSYVGPVSGTAKAAVLASASILAIPGSIGLVAVDGLAAGRPIVTTSDNRHGPEFDYLEAGHTAVVSESAVPAYAQALIDLFKDSEKLSYMQENCRVVGESFSVEIMAENFLRGILEFLKRKSS